MLTNTGTGEVLYQVSRIAPKGTWYPDLRFDTRDLFPVVSADGVRRAGSVRSWRQGDFYACPGNLSLALEKKCGGSSDYFCKVLGCETTGVGSWTKDRDEHITLSRGNGSACYTAGGAPRELCNPVIITFKETARKTDWELGKTWGLYRPAEPDTGALITIRLVSQLPVFPKQSQALGPNKGRLKLNQSQPQARSRVVRASPLDLEFHPKIDRPKTPIKAPTPAARVLAPPNTSPIDQPRSSTSMVKNSLSPGPLGLLEAAYQVLNASRPDLTEACWLCLDRKPPYYEGIAIMGDYSVSSDALSCRWQQAEKGKLTSQLVTGNGLCIGHEPPQSYSHLCNKTQMPVETGYIVAPENAWWACTTGLTPCIHTQVLNHTKDFCVLTQLVPKIAYRPEKDLDYWLEKPNSHRMKREPMVTVTLTDLLGPGIAEAGRGISATITQGKNYQALQEIIEQDITKIEKSVSHLQESLTSLSEVVLQNARDLDLLILQREGLCAALGQECCFYADHSGLVKESVALLRKRLQEHKVQREQSQNWYESLYNWSPWLATLMSALAGPIFLLLLALACGPCIVNAFLKYVKERVTAVQLMILKQRYQPLEPSREFEMEAFSTGE